MNAVQFNQNAVFMLAETLISILQLSLTIVMRHFKLELTLNFVVKKRPFFAIFQEVYYGDDRELKAPNIKREISLKQVLVLLRCR